MVWMIVSSAADVAMLLADDKGASLIVAVGTHATLVEFLDKNRRGMSSTFLTRLRLGEILVDAKGVSRLYRPRPGFAISSRRRRRSTLRSTAATVPGRFLRAIPPTSIRRPGRSKTGGCF